MINYLLRTYEHNLDYAKRLVADVPDAKMTAQPIPGVVPGAGSPAMNHAAWVLGHLAQSSGFITHLLGQGHTPPPAAWEKLFGWGSKPAGDPNLYPCKAELLKVLEENHRRAAAAVAKADVTQWGQPFPIAQMRHVVPTLGDGLVFLLTAHESGHLGQLSAWRRAQGLAAV